MGAVAQSPLREEGHTVDREKVHRDSQPQKTSLRKGQFAASTIAGDRCLGIPPLVSRPMNTMTFAMKIMPP